MTKINPLVSLRKAKYSIKKGTFSYSFFKHFSGLFSLIVFSYCNSFFKTGTFNQFVLPICWKTKGDCPRATCRQIFCTVLKLQKSPDSLNFKHNPFYCYIIIHQIQINSYLHIFHRARSSHPTSFKIWKYLDFSLKLYLKFPAHFSNTSSLKNKRLI